MMQTSNLKGHLKLFKPESFWTNSVFLFWADIVVSIWVWGPVNSCTTMSITPNYPCLIASVRAARLMGRIFHHGEDPVAPSGRGSVGSGTKLCRAVMADGVGGTVRLGVGTSGLLSPPTPLFFSKWSRNHRASSQNHDLTTTWGTETPFEEQRRGRESFGGHHCGNVVNCAFLRPWESHGSAGTCGHGKWGATGGQRPQREGWKQHRCGSDGLCSLLN